QMRRRMVLLASMHGDIKMIAPTIIEPKTVKQSIGHLPSLSAGEVSPTDRLHISAKLSDKNLERIKVSKPVEHGVIGRSILLQIVIVKMVGKLIVVCMVVWNGINLLQL